MPELAAIGRVLGSWPSLEALAIGTVLGLILGLLPGVSGRVGLILVTPFTLGMDPLVGAVLLVAMHSVVHTSGSIPAILFGVPTSASEAATVVDGYPMVRAGKAGEAVGAIIGGSAIGGAIGAFVLIALVPVARAMYGSIGSPEVAMLGLLGLFSVSMLAGDNLARGLALAAAGILASAVGVDDLTGTPRYTFGRLELWDGLEIAAMVAGIFVVPDTLLMAYDMPAAGPVRDAVVRIQDVLRGCWLAFRHFGVVLRSSLVGVAVGIIPGIGAGAGVWIAYGHATQTTRSAVPFGSGAVEGVLAAEAANNSKEGGVLAPSLLFGIPTSTSMAILLGAFSLMGVEVGPRMVARDPGFVAAIGWTILLANLLAVLLCLAITPGMTRFALLQKPLVVPCAVAAALIAALATAPDGATLTELAAFGVFGTFLRLAGWPRAPFVLGFVIGPVFESALSRSLAVYGTAAAARPGVIVIALMAVVLLWFTVRTRRRNPPAPHTAGSRASLVLTLGLGAMFAAAGGIAATRFPGPALVAPCFAAIVGLATCAVVVRQDSLALAAGIVPGKRIDRVLALSLLLFMLGILAVGAPLAGALFTLAMVRRAEGSWLVAILAALTVLLGAMLLIGDAPGWWRPVDALLHLSRRTFG